jgi:hypothetical protein
MPGWRQLLTDELTVGISRAPDRRLCLGHQITDHVRDGRAAE